MSGNSPTRLTGRMIKDESVREVDLGDDTVSTRTIINNNVTRPKLSQDVRDVLLTSPTLVTRIYIFSAVPANTDISMPLNFAYTSNAFFANRYQIQHNGSFLWNGENQPTAAPLDPIDVFPGTTNRDIRFAWNLDPTDKIIILRL